MTGLCAATTVQSGILSVNAAFQMGGAEVFALSEQANGAAPDMSDARPWARTRLTRCSVVGR